MVAALGLRAGGAAIVLLIKSLRIGFRRRWWEGLKAAFATIGAIWLATEIIGFLFDGVQDWFRARPALYFGIIGSAALATFFARIYEPRVIRIVVPTTNTHLTLKYGNLFDESSDLLIAVNEFFDGELGPAVAADSIHGQFIQLYFQSNGLLFRNAVDPLLASFVGQTVPQRPSQNLPLTKYPIGTTINVPIGTNEAFLVAMSNTNVQTHRASANVSNFWVAVTNALESVYHLNNGRPLALPLIGNGRSSLNLEPQHLLRLLVLAVVDTARKMQLPNEITITLPEACFDKLDLREFALSRSR